MANANFLEEFDKSLQKLGQLNNIIAANTQKKKEYSEDIINKLKAINEKIQGLLGKINQLKVLVVDAVPTETPSTKNSICVVFFVTAKL